MRALVFENAFLGQPFDVICPCQEWFSDVVLGPYIKYEPQNVQVAIHRPSGRLIGYLTGSTGGQEFEKLQYEYVRSRVMSLAMSLAMPWNFFDQSSRQFLSHVIINGERERPSHPAEGVHWHFQVDRDFRGQGIGEVLLQGFVDDAVAEGFERIWAEVMSYQHKSPEYYKERGWSIYDVKPTMIFGDHVDFPVQVMSIERPLSSLKEMPH